MNLRPTRIKTTRKPRVKRVHRQLAVLKMYLRSLGLEFVEEHTFHETRKWRFDLAVPALKLAIEYQGHGATGKTGHVGGHASITGLTQDCEKDFQSVLAGWRVLKFTALHFTPKKRLALKLTHPLDAISFLAAQAKPCAVCGGNGGHVSANSGQVPHRCEACDGTGISKN